MESILTYSTSVLQKNIFNYSKEKIEDFTEILKGETVIGDKGYVSKEFSEKQMEKKDIIFVAIKRKNMIKSDEEIEYFRFLSKLRKKIKHFSQL